jgi:hypothetical protein
MRVQAKKKATHNINSAPLRDLVHVLAEFYTDPTSEPSRFEDKNTDSASPGQRGSMFGRSRSALQEQTERMNCFA